MRKINKLTACLLAMVFMVGLLVPAYAGQLDDKRQELNQVEREIQKQRSKINQARKKEKDISKDLAILDRGMETTRGETQPFGESGEGRRGRYSAYGEGYSAGRERTSGADGILERTFGDSI